MFPTTLKAKLTILATFVAIVGGIITAANQANVAEPMWFATRSFVRDQVEVQRTFIKAQVAPLETRQIGMEIAQVQAARDVARDKKFDLQVLLEKPDGLTPDLRHVIEKQQQDLQDRIDALNSRLQQLKSEKR